MADLKSISELAWRKINPPGSDEAANTKEEFLATARTEYAYQTLLMYWKQKRDEGEYEIPSHLLAESDPLQVENDEIDISELEIFRTFPDDLWLRKVGQLTCLCNYVRSTTNRTELLCDDDSLADNEKTYIVVGSKIKFPKGTHASELSIIYANKGENIDGSIDVDDAIGAIVRIRLEEIYGNKVNKSDESNDSNANQ